MAKDYEVFVLIECQQEANKIPSEKEINRVRKEIEAIKGVKETYFQIKVEGANIVAFAYWEERDIQSKVAEIKKIPGVTNVQTKMLVPAN